MVKALKKMPLWGKIGLGIATVPVGYFIFQIVGMIVIFLFAENFP